MSSTFDDVHVTTAKKHYFKMMCFKLFQKCFDCVFAVLTLYNLVYSVNKLIFDNNQPD